MASITGEPMANDLTLTVKAEFCAYSHTSRHDCWAVANIKAPLCQPESRVPIDVVAVIDVSSSMAGEKLNLVKKTLLYFIDQLKESDRFSLVTYDCNVYLKFGLIKMTPNNKTIAATTIEAMRDGSSTNLCGGLLKGMGEVAYNSGSEKAMVQSVLLLTDGLANNGVTTKDGILAEMMQIQNPQGEKVAQKKFDGTVYTFGFGADHDASMLEAISTQVGGVYYYIDTNEKIPQSFADCLGGLISVVGQNLSLKLEIQGDNSLNEVHCNHTVNWTIPSKSCVFGLGDIQCGEGKDIVLSLVLPALAVPETACALKVTLSYLNVISSSMQTISCELVVSRTDTDPGAPDTHLDQQRNRITAAAALKRTKVLADSGNFEGAKSLLKETIVQMEQCVSSHTDFSKALMVDLRRSMGSLTKHAEYQSYGQQYICSKAQAHAAQRSNFVDEQTYYQGDLKIRCRADSLAFCPPSQSKSAAERLVPKFLAEVAQPTKKGILKKDGESKYTAIPTVKLLDCLPSLVGGVRKNLNIIQKTSTSYTKLGMYLLDDDNCDIVFALRVKYQNDPVEIVTAIYREWISGTGRKPVTWQTLIGVLRGIKQDSLADDIQHAVNPPNS